MQHLCRYTLCPSEKKSWCTEDFSLIKKLKFIKSKYIVECTLNASKSYLCYWPAAINLVLVSRGKQNFVKKFDICVHHKMHSIT